MEPLASQLQSIHITLQALESYRRKIEWVAAFLPQGSAIADFGCSVGHESLSMALFLHPAEVVGLDIDPAAIRQAQDTTRDFGDQIVEARRLLPYVKQIRADVDPSSAKLLDALQGFPMPRFLEADFTRLTPLPSDHFDLAYCERVLYHLACTDGQPSPEGVRPALVEMLRVVKPSGLIVAIEPPCCSPENQAIIDLIPLLEGVGGRLVNDEDLVPQFENRRTYVAHK